MNWSNEVVQHPAWALIAIGVVIAGIGLVWLLAPSIPWLGKLPGDIRIESENTRVYIPITTCILLSLLLTGIMWVVRYFSR
mgnify:CR=1 FL=1